MKYIKTRRPDGGFFMDEVIDEIDWSYFGIDVIE